MSLPPTCASGVLKTYACHHSVSCIALLYLQPKTTELVQTCNPSIWEAKAGLSPVPSQPLPYKEFEASLSYKRPCFKNTTELQDNTDLNLSRS